MTESCFTDSKHRPTPEEIRSALGSCFPLWERLTTFIKKSYRIEGTWSTWGPAKSGWNLRYRRNGKSLTALHPQQERILAQIVLGKAQAERALQLELGEKISRMLQEPAVARRPLAVHSSDQRIRCQGCGEAAAGKDATAPEHIMRAMAIPTGLMQLE